MSTESETPRNIATPLNPQGSVASDIKARLPEISDYKSHDFDTGVFHYEMLKLAIVPDAPPAYAEVVKKGVDPREQGVLEGTFEGTQRALTEAFNMAEKQ